MTEPVVNPHDRFFKQVFSRQEVTSDFLRTYLPVEIVELLDIPSLELSKDSYVDDTLKEHFSDLRYLSLGTDKITERELNRVVRQVFSEGGVAMPSLAEKWIEQGRQEGLQQGLQQGLHQGLLGSIELGLELRFGSEGLRLLPEVRKIEDVDVLYAVQEALKLAETPQDIRRIYQ